MIKKIIIFISLIFLIINIASADEAIVNIDFNLNNIATTEGMQQVSGADSIFSNMITSSNPNFNKTNLYEEIIKYENDIRRQTVEGRSVRVNWNIKNYEPNINLLSPNFNQSNYTRAYHLFDFTWFMYGMVADFKEKNGQWTYMTDFPSTFDFETESKAHIIGYGDAPVIISPTICPLDTCLLGIGGMGEHYGEFNRTIKEEIIRANYKIKIIKYPVTKSVYLILNDSELINKKLEISGDFRLGDNVIETEINPFYYPFDTYSFNFIYTAYYPSEIIINMDNIEDLDLSTSKKLELSAEANKNYDTNITLLRKDISTKFIWPIVLGLIGLILSSFENHWKIERGLRIATYIIAFVGIYVFLPTGSNVPTLNLLNIAVWLSYIILLIIIEIIYYKKAKAKNKKIITNKNIKRKKYINARKK